MADRRGVVRALAAFAALVLLAAPAAADDEAVRVRGALHDLSRHAVDVLLQPNGQVRAEYDMVASIWHDYETHWHTGQMIWALVETGTLLDAPGLIAAARRAGDWWISTEYRAPHPLAGLVAAAHGDRLGPLLNWTTISDGTPGLFALSRATGDTRYADSATRSGEWLWAHTRVPSSVADGQGLFYNIIDAQRGVVVTDWNPHRQGLDYSPEAARAAGSPPVHEVARPNIEGFLFQDMHRHTGDPVWRERFIEQARHALSRQDEKGLWMAFEPNDATRGRVHPRFNIWNAEALLQAYHLTGERAFLEGAAKTARFHRDASRKDGAIHYTLFIDGGSRPDSVTGSAVAFNGVLMLRLKDYGYREFDAAIERARDWLLANRFDAAHPDPNLAGAVMDIRNRSAGGRAKIINRDLGTTFAMRFLALYLRDLSGEDVNLHLNGGPVGP